MCFASFLMGYLPTRWRCGHSVNRWPVQDMWWSRTASTLLFWRCCSISSRRSKTRESGERYAWLPPSSSSHPHRKLCRHSMLNSTNLSMLTRQMMYGLIYWVWPGLSLIIRTIFIIIQNIPSGLMLWMIISDCEFLILTYFYTSLSLRTCYKMCQICTFLLVMSLRALMVTANTNTNIHI